ncbi:MAG: rod shape-determining protein MreC [Candidatus Omnitrophica bacterium]|nr:rod shape-determining protein MreC [Candidatus Omnitrophota bacterium]
MFKLSRKTIINLIIVVCTALLVYISSPFLKNSTQKTFNPHLGLIGLLKRECSGIIFYHRNMVKLERLSSEAENLRRRLFDLREIEQENLRLKSILNFKQRSPLRIIPARVIARSPDSWSSSVIIDKGRDSGIRTGMAVINTQGLVGRVIESSGSNSKILLINDPSQGVSSIVQRTRQEGLASGSLGANLIMRYLPADAQIAVGDIIITSELSRVYPKGLLVGTVVNIGKEFSGLSCYAVVKPAVKLSDIEEVLVIIP